MKGIFELRTPNDLLLKLEADFKRVEADALDSFAAYDFFVTAWHLVEWKHPPSTDAAGRAALLARAPVLRVCEHLAVGAKHFEPDQSRHTSVADTESSSVWAQGVWAPGTWAPEVWAGDLVVRLDGAARAVLGDQLTVRELAQIVIDVWKREFEADERAA
jgi:hypothetical protein